MAGGYRQAMFNESLAGNDKTARNNRRIVTVIADTGQRYLSGELFGERTEVDEPDRDHTPDPDILEQVAVHRDRLEFIS